MKNFILLICLLTPNLYCADSSSDSGLRKSINQSKTYNSVMSFSPCGKVLVMADGEFLHFIDSVTKRALGTSFSIAGLVNTISFSHKSDKFVVASKRGHIALYDASTEGVVNVFKKHKLSVNATSFFSGGDCFMSGSDDKTMRIWDLRTGKPEQKIPCDEPIKAMSISLDDNQVFYGQGGCLRIFKPKKSTVGTVFEYKGKEVSSLICESDSECFVGSNRVDCLKYNDRDNVWELVEKVDLPEEDIVTNIFALHDSEKIIGTKSGRLYKNNKRFKTFIKLQAPSIKTFAISPDKKKICLYSYEDRISFEDVEDLEVHNINLPIKVCSLLVK